MQRTNIYLSDWQKEQLQLLGKQYDTNTSELIRRAVDEYLHKHLPPSEIQAARNRIAGARIRARFGDDELNRLADLCEQRIAEGNSVEADHITEPSHAKVAA